MGGRAADAGQVGVVGLVAGIDGLAVLFGGEGVEDAGLEGGGGEGVLDDAVITAGTFDGHQAITEMAETGASDATMMALAGHMSQRMLEHYSHVRMAAKRTAVEKLESGLMGASCVAAQPAAEKIN